MICLGWMICLTIKTNSYEHNICSSITKWRAWTNCCEAGEWRNVVYGSNGRDVARCDIANNDDVIASVDVGCGIDIT